MEELLEVGIKTPNKSPYVSLVVMARENHGSYHISIDYRVPHQITIKNKFLMDCIDDLMEELHGTQLFSKIDLISCFYQIPKQIQDQKKIAIRT